MKRGCLEVTQKRPHWKEAWKPLERAREAPSPYPTSHPTELSPQLPMSESLARPAGKMPTAEPSPGYKTTSKIKILLFVLGHCILECFGIHQWLAQTLESSREPVASQPRSDQQGMLGCLFRTQALIPLAAGSTGGWRFIAESSPEFAFPCRELPHRNSQFLPWGSTC